MLRTWQDAEECAAAWVRAMGHSDAQVTAAGADGGIDVTGRHALAQVKFRAVKASRPELQQLLGAAGRRDTELFYFSSSGYTADALTWATDVGIAAFLLRLDGYVTPLNVHAEGAARVAAERPEWRPREQPRTVSVGASVAGQPPQARDQSGFWRRVGSWFARLFRTVAFEAGGARGTAHNLMTGNELMNSGLIITIVGIVGVLAMTSVAFDPAERAVNGLASAIAGVVFYALVACFGTWTRRLGRTRRDRVDEQNS